MTPEEEALIARLKVNNFKELSKREKRFVPHQLLETTPIRFGVEIRSAQFQIHFGSRFGSI